MRTLHLVLTPRLSGAEMLVKDLALHQRAYGDDVCVAALLPEHDDYAPLRLELERNEVVCRFPQRRLGFSGKLWNLLRVIREFKPEVVFAHATIPAFYVRALPISVPIVYVMHSATNDFRSPLFRWVERVLSKRARMVIGVSPVNVADYVAAVGKHHRMTVIPNGVDLERFRGTGHVPTTARPLQIIQVGRYTGVKDQLQTVRAFYKVLERIPTARLALYGVVEDLAYYEAVVALAKELDIAECVTIDGPHSDVPKLLLESTVFAMPSRSEGHSVAFLEALASGIPIVASSIEPFAFARGLANVQCVETRDTDAYANALVAALGQQRSERPMDGLTLADTADRYISVARDLAYSA